MYTLTYIHNMIEIIKRNYIFFLWSDLLFFDIYIKVMKEKLPRNSSQNVIASFYVIDLWPNCVNYCYYYLLRAHGAIFMYGGERDIIMDFWNYCQYSPLVTFWSNTPLLWYFVLDKISIIWWLCAAHHFLELHEFVCESIGETPICVLLILWCVNR